jgi:hypothetical protein
MKKQIMLCLKTAWLTAAIVVLLIGTNLCLSADETCFNAGETMLTAMFWLAFPSSILFLLVALIYLGGQEIHYPSDYITVWLIMISGGCLQWFLIVPRLFTKPEFTTLELSTKLPDKINAHVLKATGATVGKLDAKPAQHLNSAEAKSAELTNLQPTGKQKSAKRKTLEMGCRDRRRAESNNAIAEFDKQGRTPLERVMLRRL